MIAGGGGGGGRGQSMSRRSPRTLEAFWPTSTFGEESQAVRREVTREGMTERMAASVGVLEALWRMVRPRSWAAGAGEVRAWLRESSEASWRTWVKDIGRRSLMVRETITAGSSLYCWRI